MTLPYPHEVETGRLQPRPHAPRMPFDIEAHMTEAIRQGGGDLELFGVTLVERDPGLAAAAVARFRDTLTEQFQRRRPDADAASWEHFTSQARALAERHGRADDELLRALLAAVDGL